MKTSIIGMTVGMAMCTAASAAFTEFTTASEAFSFSGQNLIRVEVYANFTGATDTLLNVFNFQAVGGWASNPNGAGGFWHKDNFDSSAPGMLSQTSGSWAPQVTGNALSNRPFDSFLLVGGNPTSTNATTADPSWYGSGSNPNSWNQAQLPLLNDLGWFNSSPPNLQGRVGNGPNTATTVKIAQFILSANDPTNRMYSFTVGYNNGAGGPATFGTDSVLCPTPGAIALMGLVGLSKRRRR